MQSSKKTYQKALLASSIALLCTQAFAAEDDLGDAKGVHEEVYVTGGKEAIRTVSGSATLIEGEAITQFETTDLNALLGQVPGVYIRQEDGFGLRPNINLRGTSSDRSSKITIMEDAILIGPAPYSAPAAYYIPNVARMEAVEVFKGPSAIKYGPHTVGGAINLVTRNIPSEATGELGLTLGSYGFEKYRAFYGDSGDTFGYWVDGLRYGSDGFKDLDGGGDTGFVRNDVNAKMQWRFGNEVYQELVLKLGYADEDSDETYLGLSEDDFAADSTRRYAASQLDNFTSEHKQIHVIHSVDYKDMWTLTTRAYHNDYERAWNKFDGIIFGPDVNRVLANPDFYAQEFALLRGEVNSNPLSSQRIDITNNDRSFRSSGIQLELGIDKEIGSWTHEFEVGLRFHSDKVEREHRQRGYFMENGDLVFDGLETRPDKADNLGETDAIAVFINDEISIDAWKINVGVRFESIDSEFDEDALLREREQSDSHNVVMPGLGIFYELNDQFGVFAGVNKGFSAKAASARVEVDPEESTNYELGMRFGHEQTSVEVIGFFSDYTNLLGRCRASDSCAGEEFNGGEVETKGLELNANHSWHFDNGVTIPLSLIYTYSKSEFTTSFESNFTQWGDYVEAGFELPYLPEHQGRAQVGILYEDFSANLAYKYVDKMREVAGEGEYVAGEFTEELATLDVALEYRLTEALAFKLVGENITDEQEIVSRRPYGARPNQPRTFKFGVTYSF